MHNPKIVGWINEQPIVLQPIFTQLRQLILDELPYIREYMAYQIPFYSGYRRICYLNNRQGVVEVGLCQGAFLSNKQGLLTGYGKEVRHIRVHGLAGIKQLEIRAILQEAMLWDQLKNRHKNA
jgi:hypothetical protein